MNEARLVIEPLGSQHDRKAFSCGVPALDSYVQRQASQDVRRRVAQVFVARGSTPRQIAGYYSLSAASFERANLPPPLEKRLPHYPVPAAILGRLAVDSRHQGAGLGELLLIDAIRRVVLASTTIGVYALVVDAKDDRARAFYERYGFLPFRDDLHRLFLPLETFQKLGL